MRNELTALRGAMEAAGVDAYVVPTDDFHGSEYAGEYFMCRKYNQTYCRVLSRFLTAYCHYAETSDRT